MSGEIVPAGGRARAARLWNALAGGPHAFEGDRDAAAGIEAAWPGTRETIRRARESHARAASWAVTEGGIGRVIFGSAGLPAPLPAHTGAAALSPAARFWFADPDADVTRVRRAVIERCPRPACRQAAAVRGALSDPGGLLAACGLEGGDAPVMVQAQMSGHFWPGQAMRAGMREWAPALPPGSVLFMSLLSVCPRRGRGFADALGAAAGTPVYCHSPADVRGWLEDAGLEILRPGVADVRAWPDQGWAEPELCSSPVRAVDVAARVP
jgi:hypothetical protein